MDPIVARKTWRTVEPVHALIYFSHEATDAYASLGLPPMPGYFASRAAAMGPVGPEVVIATFYNFNPVLVRSALPAAWESARPDVVIDARTTAAGRALERVLGSAIDEPAMVEAADLARRAALAACDHLEGRPLFAAHSGLDWPEPPHLVLWHAQMLLREFRGDGHVAILTSEELSGIEALVLHAATGAVTKPGLLRTRGWTELDWQTAVDGLVARGLVDGSGAFTEQGAALREHIEVRTDTLAMSAYTPLGDEQCARLRTIVRPWSRLLVDAMGPT